MLDRKKKLAILSNTSSPSHVALKRLKKYDLREDMFAGGLVSSGEECAKFVRENYSNSCIGGGASDKAKKALWLTWKESESQKPLHFLSHCGSGTIVAPDDIISGGEGTLDVANSVEEADFILLHGSEVWRRSRLIDHADDLVDLNFLSNEDFSILDPLLASCKERNLPMACANPDLIVGLPNGVVGNMPGKIAQRYEKMGGVVYQFGKPNTRHFHACLENLGIVFDAGAKSIPAIAHVGDSLEHDVAGANAAGIDSIFVLGGIHARELGLIPTGSEDDGVVIKDDGDAGGRAHITRNELMTKLHSFFDEKRIWPTHVVPSLSMGR